MKYSREKRNLRINLGRWKKVKILWIIEIREEYEM